ncbi:hypothetical protein EGJ86_22190 [Pseudomonas sp. o96-267]|nr:hypothetical protein EGJ86_22190 [Pseudomonas sp. o96-267]
MAGEGGVFRRTLRIPVSESGAGIEAQLIEYMESLEKDSPHRLQEWMRHCVRTVFVQEQQLLNKERLCRGGE